MVNESSPPPKQGRKKENKSSSSTAISSNVFQPPQSTPLTDPEPKKKKSRHDTRKWTKPVQNTQQLKAYMSETMKEGSESGSEAWSELDVGSETEFSGKAMKTRQRRAKSRLQSGTMPSNIALSSSKSSTSDGSTSTTLSSDSLDSSIHKFRDDFEEFKCKMKIFGESLNLCKCIASDFKGRLTTMEGKLFGLEKRQKINKTHNNYTAIIKKNKELETKTKEFVTKLQKCGTEEEMREVAGRICKNYLHGLWKVAHAHELQFKKITGGLSNFIYAVGLPEDLKPLYARISEMDEEDVKAIQTAIETGDEPKQVLLRIYGQVHGERAMDAIVTESVIFTLLSERRLGPKLFGVFSGGRIEEFIPARALYTRELSEPAISMKIAEKTAAIHSMEIPLSKEPNYLWKTMYKWLKTVKEECFNNGIVGKNEIEQNAIKQLKEMNYDHEIEWLKKYLLTFDSAVVFCHNDLQEGNILLFEGEQALANDEYESAEFTQTFRTSQQIASDKESEHSPPGSPEPRPEASWLAEHFDSAPTRPAFMSQTEQSLANFLEVRGECEDTVLSEPAGEPKLYLIDFEYCAYNYRAFDIANHFQEWAYDYTNPNHPYYYERQEDWPTLEQKEIFIREYLKYYNANTNDDKQPVAPDIDSVNKLLAEVEAFALASHLFWTLWSIVNASKSQIPFGYWEYGLARLESYQRIKQEMIKKDQFGLPQKRKIEEVDI